MRSARPFAHIELSSVASEPTDHEKEVVMRRLRIPALLIAVMCAGCYHVTVVTGAPPAPRPIDKQWQLGWVYGLVPPPELDVKEPCPLGISKVETERSFLNGLVSGLTYSIFAPMHTTVTCASGPVAK